MAREIKYLDPAEFRRIGLLQEANRQFFHPHGLALSVRIIETDWEEKEIEKSPWMAEQVERIVEALQFAPLYDPEGDERDEDELRAIARDACQRLWPKGSTHLAGIWDDREDPEGVYFGDGVDPKLVAGAYAERKRHATHRAAFFGVPIGRDVSEPATAAMLYQKDVQPPDWEPPDGAED